MKSYEDDNIVDEVEWFLRGEFAGIVPENVRSMPALRYILWYIHTNAFATGYNGALRKVKEKVA